MATAPATITKVFHKLIGEKRTRSSALLNFESEKEVGQSDTEEQHENYTNSKM